MTITGAVLWCRKHSKTQGNELLLEMLETNNKNGVFELTEKEANDFVKEREKE